MTRPAVVVASVLLLAGCGSTATRTVTRIQQCNGITADLSFHYAICGNRFVRDGKTLAIGRPPRANIGRWSKAYLSPDGKTFLAQWLAECEVPRAFLVPVRGGVPRVVTGETDWTTAHPSVADGWTGDGRAIVEVWPGDCGPGAKRAKIYLVAHDGTRTAIG